MSVKVSVTTHGGAPNSVAVPVAGGPLLWMFTVRTERPLAGGDVAVEFSVPFPFASRVPTSGAAVPNCIVILLPSTVTVTLSG